MIIKLYSMLVLLMFSGLVNAYVIYTDKTAWEDALSEAVIITEDFEDGVMAPGLDFYTIPQPHRNSSIFHNFNLIPSSDNEATFDTQAFQELVEGSTPRSVVWNFSSPLIAFGGNWNLKEPAGEGTGLAIKINGIIQNEIIPSSYAGEFWGFVAEQEDPAFLTVEILKPALALENETEVYHLDDMVYATVVPLPAAIWFLGSGFIGLLGYKKRFS